MGEPVSINVAGVFIADKETALHAFIRKFSTQEIINALVADGGRYARGSVVTEQYGTVSWTLRTVENAEIDPDGRC